MKNTKKALKYKASKNKHTTEKDKNDQIHSHIKIHLNSINKIGKYKKLNMTEHKVDMHSTKIDKYKKDWTAILWRSTEINITKYKKLIMTEQKTDKNITKIEKYKKLNMTEHKTDMNITKIDKYKKNNKK